MLNYLLGCAAVGGFKLFCEFAAYYELTRFFAIAQNDSKIVEGFKNAVRGLV